MVINKLICNRLFMERKIPQIILMRSQSSPRILGNLSRFVICGGVIGGLSVTVKNAFLYFHFLAFFFLFFIKNFVFIIIISFLDEVYIEFRQQNINQSKTRICELNEVCGNYVWILKCVNLHCNWISLISVLSFPKQWVADYRCVFRTVKQLRWSV